jgi:hypothetical protein
MKNTLRLDHEKRAIVMDRTFAKLAEDTFSPEYEHLQNWLKVRLKTDKLEIVSK